ncbi:MAG: glycosyltransferase [Candidatus Zambryskibacteria bacterium]|nr:glycosyltransferase [Candidatus Zambryskibacteria bacterium]
MKIISIGTDRRLFEDGSAVLARNVEYASKMEELHIIVFSLKKLGLEPKSIDNLYFYPTNSTTRLGYIFDAIKLGKKIILENKLVTGSSVISTQDPFETGMVGYFLRRKFNFPLQLQIHTDFLSPYFKNSFLNMVRVRIAKFLIPRAQGLRVVSEVIKDSINKHFPNLKIIPETLPVFVDIEKILDSSVVADKTKTFSQFKFSILMASRLTKEKRIDIALHVLKKVIVEFPQTGLIILGDGDERKSLENLTKKFGLSNNVVFVGWQKDLFSYYKTANLFLLTSEYEGYGMSLIEAGASECPIVTTQVGIANTSLFINDKNSFICPVGDVECIFKAISELIHNNIKRELFKREMQDSIKNIMIPKEEYTAKYIALLENLIEKKA